MSRIRKNLFGLAAIAAVAAMFCGCCACRSYQKQTRRPLVGTEWQLIQLGGRNVRTEGEQFTVRFAADGTFSGLGSCNRLTGPYTTDAERALKIGPLAATLMACPSGEDTERVFAAALEAADHYDVDGPMLLLLADGELRAVLQARPE